MRNIITNYTKFIDKQVTFRKKETKQVRKYFDGEETD